MTNDPARRGEQEEEEEEEEEEVWTADQLTAQIIEENIVQSAA